VIAVWGERFLELFTKACLPSLLADRNLPAAAREFPCSVHVYTTEAGKAALERDALAADFRRHLPFVVHSFGAEAPRNAMEHHRIWRVAYNEAEQAGHLVFLISPDSVWSNGALSHVFSLLRKGKRLIAMVYIRVALETAMPELEERRGHANGAVIDLSFSEVADLAVRHMDLYHTASFMGSGNMPKHLEVLVWPEPRPGFAARAFGLHPTCMDPRDIRFDGHSFRVRRALAPSEIGYVTEPAGSAVISLTPFARDLPLCFAPKPATVLDVARWWLNWYNPLLREFPLQDFRFEVQPELASSHTWSRSPEVFGRQTLAANDLMAIAWAMHEHGLTRSAELVALAIETGGLHERLPTDFRLTIYAPVDEAHASLRPQVLRGLADDPRRMRRFLAGHTIRRDSPGMPLPATGDTFEVRGHLIVPVREFLVQPGV
jgi:hypothetical protein